MKAIREGISTALLVICCLFSAQPAKAETASTHHVATGSRPAIAADGKGHLLASFEAYAGGAKVPDIFFSESTDRGAHWSPPKNISMTPGVSEHSHIAVEKSGAIDVIWTDTSSEAKSPDIYFVRSTDSGQTWTKPLDISNTPGVSLEPALAIGLNDVINVVWSDTAKGEKNKEIYYCSSRDAGKTWTPPVDVSNTSGASYAPAIAVGPKGMIHVAWEDTTSSDARPDIYYVQRGHDFEKSTWSRAVNISRSKGVSSHPTLACSGTHVFLSWSDNSRKETAPDIWLSVGNASGRFAHVLNMSDTPGVSTEPKAATAGDNLAIVWSDTSTGTETPSIYGIASPDNAGDFSSWMNVSKEHNMAKHPDVAIAGGKMFVIWEEIAISNGGSSIKTGSVDIKGLATGPPLFVDPKLHGVSGNMH